MMIVTDTNVTPHGGWRYIQPETGFEFRSFGYRDIIEQVALHRRSNGLPERNPGADIEAFVCAQLPAGSETCSQVLDGDYALKKSFTMEDVKRFIQAAASALGSRGLVAEEKAEARAAICSTCPLNTSVSGCWTCKGLAEWLFKLIGARSTVHDSRLNQCGVCGCSLKAKIWLPQDVAQKVSEGYKFPSWCWLKENPAAEPLRPTAE